MPKPKHLKARKAGRPPLPKGNAKDETLRIRVTPDELRAIEHTAKDSKQTVSEWIRSTLMRSWVLTCKNKECRETFTYKDIDELHPRETVNNPNDEPPKPPFRPLSRLLKCPHCKEDAFYRRSDLRLQSSPQNELGAR
jgi:hypothetical protein